MHFTVKGRGSFKIMLSKKQGSNAEKETSETSTGWLAKVFGLVKAVKHELWFQKKNDKED